MESMDINATNKSLDYRGSRINHVVEDHSLRSENFDAPIGDENNAAEQPDCVIIETLEESQMATTTPRCESKSVMHDEHSLHDSMTSESLGYGFEMGDMVWGKVKSHPWWPGHIFSEGFASASVRRTKKEGHVLVAFYGDSSYGWFDPAELIPFEPHFAEKSQQWTSRNFVKAVDESVDEACRRSALGLTCFCRNPCNFRPTNVPGHVAVDVFDFEAGGIYSDNQIRKVRANFQPERTLLFIEQLAVASQIASTSLDFLKEKATAMAYRRAVFQEFDETYNQAFGDKTARRVVAPSPSIDQSIQARFSGPYVIAESLSGHRSSPKALNSKGQIKRERFLLNKKDESGTIGFSQITQGHSSSSSSPSYAADGDHTLQRRDQHVDQREDTTPTQGAVASRFIPNKPVVDTFNEVEYGRLSMVQEQSDPPTAKSKKDGVLKGALKRPDTKRSDFGEVNKKKRRIELLGSSDHPPKYNSAGGPSVRGESPGISDNSGVEHVKENRSEPKQVLADLKMLALNPFHGRERNRPTVAREIFLRFRSIVFEKSLAVQPSSSTSGDKEASETRSVKTLSRDTARTAAPLSRPPKSSGKTDHPTKGQKKLVPSERQEDLAAKKAKRISDGRPVAQAAVPAKKMKANLETPQKIGEKLGPGLKMQPSKARLKEPTLLMIKYPPGTSVPSSAELKARFARFGPMDTSQMRVFYHSNICRIVFLFKEDAESAHQFAESTYAQVKLTLKPLYVASDSQAADKLGRDPSRAGEDESIDYVQPIAVQLKSCLKKPTDDEAATQSTSSPRVARVRFNVAETTDTNISSSSLSEARPGASFSVASDSLNNKKKIISTLPLQPPLVPAPRNNPTHLEAPSRSHSQNYNQATVQPPPPSPLCNQALPPPPPQQRNQALPPPPPRQAPAPVVAVDISHEMLSLMMRCNDVVSQLKSVYGYVPCHPL